MRTSILLSLALLAVPLAGCVGDDAGSIPEGSFDVQWNDVPEEVDAGEAFNVSFSVDGDFEGEVITAVAHGNESVDDPANQSAYPNRTGEETTTLPITNRTVSLTFDEPGVHYVRAIVVEAEAYAAGGANATSEQNASIGWSEERRIVVRGELAIPGVIDVSLQAENDTADVNADVALNWSLTTTPAASLELLEIHASQESTEPDAAAYEDDPLVSLDEFEDEGTTNVSFQEAATWHLRLRVIDANGQDAWSDEITIEVGAADGAANEPHVVEAQDAGPLKFAPANLTIKLGETVRFENAGPFLDHTIVFEELNGTEDFELGTLANGENVSWTFTEPGEYRYMDPDYADDYGYPEESGAGMVGVIIVEAPDGAEGA